MKIINKSKNKFGVFIAITLLALILTGSWLTYAYSVKRWPFTPSQHPTSAENSSTNHTPNREEEAKMSQDAKKRGSQTDQSSTSPNPASTSSRKKVNVGISSADVIGDNLEVRAFTNGVVEGNGTCTATITQLGKSITKTSKAFIDVSSSICRPIYVPLTQLGSGTWQINVTYSSPDAEGQTTDSVEIK